VIWPKRLLYLCVGGVTLYITTQLPLNWITRLGLVILPLVALEVILQLLVRGRSRQFDQRLYALLQAERPHELLPLYQRQILLRFAAPRHYTQGKLGLIYAKLGRQEEAASAYREALEEAPEAKRYALALSLGNSLYELGDAEEAEEVYRSATDEDHINVQACANLSRLIVKRGGDLGEAELYLKKAVEAARGGALRSELVLLLLKQGKSEEARWQLSLAEEQLAHEELSEQDRRSLKEAREALESQAADQAPEQTAAEALDADEAATDQPELEKPKGSVESGAAEEEPEEG
jgi:tetratricopeptide (TPR) repeat protein